MSDPERIIPDETDAGIVALHLKRYAHAAERCRDADVLDAGCGVGYGAAYLAAIARSVVAVDVDRDAIDYAQRRYGGSGARFEVMDVQELTFDDDSFDVVTSFEALEHVVDPERMIGGIRRVLRPDGAFFVSTPHAPATTYEPANPFHHVEYSREDFERLLRLHFLEVDVLGQARRQTPAHRALQRLDVLGLRRRVPALRVIGRATGTAPMAEMTLDDTEISAEALPRADYLVAVCRSPR